MSKRERYEFESDVRQIAVKVRAAYSKQLVDLGLEAKIGLSKHFHEGVLDAELRITFLRHTNLIDFLEGFVIKNDIPVISDEELTSWLHQSIQDVFAKATDACPG